jgi:hypothetical protein
VIKRRHVYSEQLNRVGQLIFSHRRLADPFLDQNGRLATLGIKLFKMLNGDRFRASRVRDAGVANVIYDDKMRL